MRASKRDTRSLDYSSYRDIWDRELDLDTIRICRIEQGLVLNNPANSDSESLH